MDYSKLGKRRKSKQSSQTTRVRNKISLLMLRISLAIVLIGGFAIMGAVLGLYLGILDNAPALNLDLSRSGYHSSVIVNVHTGEEMVRLHGGHNHETATIDQIPLHVQNAFIAIEDERFWEHNGVDIRAIGRAAYTIIYTAGARTEGASTITQQLIKNMLEAFDSDLITKLQEQYLAINFERDLTEMFDGNNRAAKEFILESYLNIINLGRSNYGVQAAAQFYYGVDVSELTVAQAATIAAITQNPSRFPPDTRSANNWVRAQLVLENMHRLEMITTEEFEEAMEEVELEDGTMIGAVYNTIFRMEGGGARPIVSHFDCFTDALIDAVRDDLMREFGLTRDMANAQIFTQGLTIYSTQNLEMQGVVDRIFLDDSYWPEADFTLDIDYSMSIYNTITNQYRHYRTERDGFRNMDEVYAFVETFQAERMFGGDELVESNELLLVTPQPQAAFVLLDHHTGHVLALRGVRGEKGQNRTFNRATQSTRSPGSQMKPLATFAPAFELGILQPGSVVDDVPFTSISGGDVWSPRNWWGSEFEGLSSARRGLYRSMNVVSVRAMVAPEIPHVGADRAFMFLQNFGLTTIVDRYTRASDGRVFSDLGGAMTLGGLTHGVRLIELAGAYGSFANMGELNRPVLYTMVLDHNGVVLLDNRTEPQRILQDTTAYLIIDSQKNTMTASGATGGQVNFTNQQMRNSIPISGKTGTSQDSGDLGFSGSTAYFTASIWMGNDSNQRMSRSASSYHLRAWRAIMEEIHEGLPPRDFPRPSGIVSVTICRDSGHLATDLCRADPRGSRVTSDIFASQWRPTQECTVHQRFTYCTTHGLVAGEFCPPDAVSNRVGLVRSIPITDPTANVRDRHVEFPAAVLAGTVCYLHLPGSNEGSGLWDTSDPWSPFGNTQTTPGLGILPPINQSTPSSPIAGEWSPIIPSPPIQSGGETQFNDIQQPTQPPPPIPGNTLPPIGSTQTQPPAEPPPSSGVFWPAMPLPDEPSPANE